MLGTGKYRGWVAALLLGGWCLALVTPLWANVKFYSVVQQICRSYRVPVTMERMKLAYPPNGTTFDLALQSRRNNFQEVMLVGYIASSQAIARTGIDVQTINITVSIPKADNMLLMTTADAKLLADLRLGKIKSSAFIRQLQWN